MLRPTTTLLILALLATPALAHADAYSWGGRVGDLVVRVVLPGNREGAGETGWTLDLALRFARHAAQLAASTRGRAVRLEETPFSNGLVAVIGSRRVPTGVRQFVASEDQWAVLNALFARLGFAARRAPPVELYAVALDAHAPRDGAPEPPGQLVSEECMPCTASRSAAHVLADGRRVVGVFADRGAAQRARRFLATRGFSGRVVRLGVSE